MSTNLEIVQLRQMASRWCNNTHSEKDKVRTYTKETNYIIAQRTHKLLSVPRTIVLPGLVVPVTPDAAHLLVASSWSSKRFLQLRLSS